MTSAAAPGTSATASAIAPEPAFVPGPEIEPGPRHRPIVVIPGDGIGPEVVGEALLLLEELELPYPLQVLDKVNATGWLETGSALTDEDFDRVRSSASVLLGAIGDPRVPDPAYARSVLLRMRFELDLYVNRRPARLLDDRLSPLRDPQRRAIDCLVIRENTEGLYAGVGGALRPVTEGEVAIDTEVNTWVGVSRVVEYAMLAATRGVCMVDKANAVPNGGALWQRCFWAAAQRFTHLQSRHLYVDVAAMQLVRDPTQFDVIVANNSYGDILSDLAAQLCGGLGVAASANLDPERGFGVFEPVHGSAPDLAGTGAANPIGAIRSAAMLLDQLGHAHHAQAIEDAVRQAVAAGRCTPDLGGSLTTAEAGAAIRAGLG